MECTICMEPMGPGERRPKCLPCGHTFCLLCLQGQATKLCAVDRRAYRGHPRNLPDNYAVLDMCEREAAAAAAASAPCRSWCRDCNKEASERCLDEHQVCSLKKARVDQVQGQLAALDAGAAALTGLRSALSDNLRVQEQELTACVRGLNRELTAMAEARARLNASLVDAARWRGEADPAAEPSAVARNAGPLLADLGSGTAATCTVVVHRGPAATPPDPGNLAWGGSVNVNEDASARLLLCRLMCTGKLEAVQEGAGEPAGLGAAQLYSRPGDSVGRWQERTNEAQALSCVEMAARMAVGSRVACGRDWRVERWSIDGTVTSVATGSACVKWDGLTDVMTHSMGEAGVYCLRLLSVPIPRVTCKCASLAVDLTGMDLRSKNDVLNSSTLVKVQTLMNLDCSSSATWARAVLSRVAGSVEVLGLVDPTADHLAAVRGMRRLREAHVSVLTGAAAPRLEAALALPQLTRLEVHTAFDAPLPHLAVPRPPAGAGLRTLCLGVYPLKTGLALARAHAETLEELELVAASAEPYGCPDLAGEVARCGLARLRRLVLWRGSHLCVCQHEAGECRVQKAQLRVKLNMEYRGSRQLDAEVLCSVCDEPAAAAAAVRVLASPVATTSARAPAPSTPGTSAPAPGPSSSTTGPRQAVAAVAASPATPVGTRPAVSTPVRPVKVHQSR